MPNIDREGIFRGEVVEAVMRQPKEGSASSIMGLKIRIEQMLGEHNQWVEWSSYGFEVYADVVIVRKNGELHENGCSQLRDAFGWDGDLDNLPTGRCSFTVKADEYEGKTRYKADWINPYEYVPQGMKAADEATIQSMKATIGPKLRAFFGATKPLNPPKPTTPPSPPPAPGVTPRLQAPPLTLSKPAVRMTQTEAWTKFYNHAKGVRPDWTDQQIVDEFGAILNRHLNGRPTATDEDWGWMGTSGIDEWVPF